MDKETLSNYGWIVILVLILSVLLAFASPFGTFIADGFKATYIGLFQTGDSALNVGLGAVGVKNTYDCGHDKTESGDHSQKECGHYNCQDADCGCVKADCGIEGHWSGDGMNHTEITVWDTCDIHEFHCQCDGWIVPEGGAYTSGITYKEGKMLPCGYTVCSGDKYTFGNYEYFFGGYWAGNYWTTSTTFDGWGVRCLNNVADPGPILGNIMGASVKYMNSTFTGCTSLTTAPAIPESIITVRSAFINCTNLVTAPAIPYGVTDMGGTFFGCISLENALSIPDSVTDMSETFSGCTALTIAPKISNNVTSIYGIFNGCTNLKTTPDLSKCTQLTSMGAAFKGCTSLVDLSDLVIPNCVTELSGTFEDCTSLKTVSAIPAQVGYLQTTFKNCTSLTGTITINATPGYWSDCFAGVDFEEQHLTLSGTSNNLSTIGFTGTNYCYKCYGKCNGGH